MSKYIKIKTIPCPEGHYQLKDEEGNIIESGTIASGQAIDIVAPDAKVINTDLTYDEDVASGSMLTLPDITVTDSDGSTLTVPAMEDVVCTPQIPLVDGVVDIRDTDNTLIGSQNVANNSTEDFIVPDSLITLKDTDGLTLQTESLKATQPLDLIAPDATVNITNSDNDLLGSVVVPSGGVDGFEVPDEDITVNGNLLVTKPSAKDYNVEVVDTENNAVSTSISGGKVVVADLPCGDGFAEIKKTDGTLITTLTVPSETTVPYNVADSVIDIDGLQWSVLATDNLGLSVVDAPNGNVVPTTQNGYEVVITGARDIRIDILFEETHDMTCEIEIDSQTASTITSMTEIGSSGAIVFLLNSVVTTAPFTLAIGDKIRFFRTDTSADGIIRLTGTF